MLRTAYVYPSVEGGEDKNATLSFNASVKKGALLMWGPKVEDRANVRSHVPAVGYFRTRGVACLLSNNPQTTLVNSSRTTSDACCNTIYARNWDKIITSVSQQ